MGEETLTPEADVEWAFRGYSLILHFGGSVRVFKVLTGSRDKIVKSFRIIADSLPISVEALSEIATSIYEERQAGWGVESFAYEVTDGFKAIHPLKNQEMSLADIIISLNDGSDWTREQIADWIDTLPEQPVYKMKSSLITPDELLAKDETEEESGDLF